MPELWTLGGIHVYDKLKPHKIMTPQILTIVTVVPFAILVAAFFIIRFWLARQPDRLVARHRALGFFIWVAAAVILAAFILRYFVPVSAPTGRDVFFMAFMLVFAIWQRQRLSRQLQER
jgi:hypothetical protein